VGLTNEYTRYKFDWHTCTTTATLRIAMWVQHACDGKACDKGVLTAELSHCALHCVTARTYVTALSWVATLLYSALLYHTRCFALATHT
jgi:hypothetical protein